MYIVEVSKKIQKTLVDLYPEIFNRMTKTLKSLAENPKPSGSIKLTGRDGFRLRIGDYRIVYEINDDTKTVIVLDIGHRSGIYKSRD